MGWAFENGSIGDQGKPARMQRIFACQGPGANILCMNALQAEERLHATRVHTIANAFCHFLMLGKQVS